ncbi:polysaccharide pyruvyl transferase WcaK-like protein [Saonia flava]|uniref:Polysaccharide pyruvyl transferase WcaK-like protein n=1 Tax=Saonia flava TaxID=523696 RepID=A0A846QW97_9FLAO|nr:polysaccharide pyruvyl transferase family protein [Saonia flava]NJB71507.1 polysaccharide pyruvyl transferase WcaK-like protein [Saonia flava]
MGRKNTFIIGHYGGDNFGDEFMLEALLEYLDTVKIIGKIFIVCKKRHSSATKATFVSPSFLSILKVFFQTKILILGGGTHFHDDYHKKRLQRHYLYLTKILAISLLYRLSFKKVYYLGVGYAPLDSPLIKKYTKLSLLLTNHITVRDKISLKNLNNLSRKPCSSREHLTFDLASLHKEVGHIKTKDETLVGISLTSFSYSSNPNEDTLWDDYIIPEIGAIYRNTTISIRIFVFRGGPKESDIPLSKKLQEHLYKIDPVRITTYEHTDDTEKFVAPLVECEYFIATRYHSAVIAYLVGCKMLIIPYHQKLIDVVDMIDLDMHAVFDLREPETFAFKFKELLANDKRYIPRVPPLKNKALTLDIMNSIFNKKEQ